LGDPTTVDGGNGYRYAVGAGRRESLVGAGGLILVVDDDPGTSETLRDILELEGHIVRTADCGRAGLETLAASPVEAAIVDLKLPDASGLDLLEAIKATSAETEVILITGHASLATAMQAIDGAAFGYLTKPFDVRQLVATLDKALEKQRLARALREAEERYRLVTEHITDAVFFLDLEGRLVFGNSRGAELTGWGRPSLPCCPPGGRGRRRRGSTRSGRARRWRRRSRPSWCGRAGAWSGWRPT